MQKFDIENFTVSQSLLLPLLLLFCMCFAASRILFIHIYICTYARFRNVQKYELKVRARGELSSERFISQHVPRQKQHCLFLMLKQSSQVWEREGAEMTERLYDNLRQFIAMLYYQNPEFGGGAGN